MKSHTRLSPYLESCCVRASANVSYSNAAEDVQAYTGIKVSAKTQHRLVHRQQFSLPQLKTEVEELSIDGGKVRLRTELGAACVWRDYKAVSLHKHATGAWFYDNQGLINWVRSVPLSPVITCLGDGHDGIWNIIASLAPPTKRKEVLDWYHLKQNLYKVNAAYKRKRLCEVLLWRGDVDAANALFSKSNRKSARNFCTYLEKHRHRIVNYHDFHAQGVSIASGRVESAVKQLDRRIQISGAQWLEQNIPQVLAQRCAYLNGMLFS